MSAESAAALEALPDWTWDAAVAGNRRAWRRIAQRCATLPGDAAEAAVSGPGSARIAAAYQALHDGNIPAHIASELAEVPGWDELAAHAALTRTAWQLRLRLVEEARPLCAGRELEALDELFVAPDPIAISALARRWGVSRQTGSSFVHRVRAKLLHPRVLHRIWWRPLAALLELATEAIFNWDVPTVEQLHRTQALLEADGSLSPAGAPS